MDIKKLAGVVGVGLTATSSAIGWAVSTTSKVSNNAVEIQNIKADVTEVKTNIHEVYRQNVEIGNKLTDILHKQDKRLDLLEYQVSKEPKRK